MSGNNSGEILCIGNALLDITFFADAAFLESHGLQANGACILDKDRFNNILGQLESRFHATSHVPGGGSQNVARTAQWLLPSGPGAVTYLGAICCDRIGTTLQEKALHSGINGVYQIVDEPTGCCLVIVSGEHNKNRSLAAHLGGAQSYTVDHLQENWALVEKAKVIYIEGFFLSTCIEACLKLGQHVASTSNKHLGLNLSAPYVSAQNKKQLGDILPFVDVLFGNAEEFEAFGKAFGIAGDLKAIAQAAANLPHARPGSKRVVVATQSDRPVIVAVSGGDAKQFDVPALPAERFVDRNGAGDAFVGGFLAQLSRGKSLDDCVRCAIGTAEITIQHIGCTFPKDKPDIEHLKFIS